MRIAAWATAYLATGATFVMMDGVWLSLAGPHLYRPALDPLLAEHGRLLPAVSFYALYIAGLTHFCVAPGRLRGWRAGLADGLFLGLVGYGVYDLTCYAVMRVWFLKLTLIDMGWGAFASATASVAGVLVTQAVFGRRAGRPPV